MRGDATGHVTSVIMAVVKAVHGHEGEVTGLVQRTQIQAVQDETTGSEATGLLRGEMAANPPATTSSEQPCRESDARPTAANRPPASRQIR